MIKKLIKAIAAFEVLFMIFSNCQTAVAYEQIYLTNENMNLKDTEEEIKVIIQLKDEPAISDLNGGKYTEDIKNDENNIKDNQLKVIKEVEKITGSSVKRRFGYLVNGFSINIKRRYIDILKKIDNVKSITEAKSYKEDISSAGQAIGLGNVWEKFNYRGEKTVVSVIDSGIDYMHKDMQNIDKESVKLTKEKSDEVIEKLGYGKYLSDKIPYAYDYADSDNNVKNEGNFHGTHVAGIIGANGDDNEVNEFKAIKGIAPQCQILAMKVFSSNPGESLAYDDDIISAIEDSIKLGADVINLSLGTASGFTGDEDPQNEAVRRATEAGIICVSSCGNKGTSTGNSVSNALPPKNILKLKDIGLVGSPSTASTCISTASCENDNVIYQVFNIDNQMKALFNSPEVKYLSQLHGEYEIVDCGKASNDDLKDKDLNGKVALIERDAMILQQQYDNISKFNVKGVIFYNNQIEGNQLFAINLKGVKLPVVQVVNIFGTSIKQYIRYIKPRLELSFEFYPISNPLKGYVTNFSSWGATSDLEIKPEITAPGGEVNSLGNNNSYIMLGGTSMASAIISGSEALIKQSIKERDLSLSGSELVSFAKNTAMNTAKPIKEVNDRTIPCSPRRQGAGLIDLKDAVKNNVTITYKDGKAAAALKEVGNRTNFKLKLTNYGNSDVTYTLKDENVYGEEVDSEYLIHEKVLEGSKAKFDKQSVTVKAGESTEVNVLLSISDNEEKNNFVEGYLNFESIDEDFPSLVVPFMGFYGDWNDEKIIDEPNYENSDSMLGVTGLASKDNKLYGTCLKDGQQYIDKDITAFSPNNDGKKDEVLPALYLLRNAKELNVDVLDSDGNKIINLYNGKNLRKNTLLSGVTPTYLKEALWNGEIYDIKTGKFVTVKDGQYIIRVTSRIDFEGAENQVLDMPIKVDTVAPKVDIKGIEKCEDKNVPNSYKILWEAKDNDGGSAIAPECEISIDGTKMHIDSNNIEERDGLYSTNISLEEGKIYDIKVVVSDNAGNIAVSEKKESTGNLKKITLLGLSNETLIGKNDLSDGQFKIRGYVDDEVEKLKVNGKVIEVYNNYFEVPVAVVEGENTINICAEDNSGNIILNNNYKIILDTESPKIEVKQKLSEREPYYTTESDELNIEFKISDYTRCSAFLRNISNKNKSISVDIDPENIGIGTIKLVEGLNNIELEVVDELGNKTVNKYYIMKINSKEELKVTIDNLNVMQYFNKNDTNNGTYTVKGHLNKKAKLLKINDREVKVNDDLTFIADVLLDEKRNSVNVYAEEEDGSVTEYSCKIYYDNTVPRITFNNIPDAKADGKIYVNNSHLNLKGKVIENLYGLNLYINGEKYFTTLNSNYASGEPIIRCFEKDIELNEGENKIEVVAVDACGNTAKENFIVVFKKDKPLKPEINLSNDRDNIITLSSKEMDLERIEYSLDGKNYFKYESGFKLFKPSKIYARAIDYAGNISEILEYEVSMDKDNISTNPDETDKNTIEDLKYNNGNELKEYTGKILEDTTEKLSVNKEESKELIIDRNNNLAGTGDANIFVFIIGIATMIVGIMIVNLRKRFSK